MFLGHGNHLVIGAGDRATSPIIPQRQCGGQPEKCPLATVFVSSTGESPALRQSRAAVETFNRRNRPHLEIRTIKRIRGEIVEFVYRKHQPALCMGQLVSDRVASKARTR